VLVLKISGVYFGFFFFFFCLFLFGGGGGRLRVDGTQLCLIMYCPFKGVFKT